MSEEKKVVANDLQSIPSDILEQTNTVEVTAADAKPEAAQPAVVPANAEQKQAVKVKKLEKQEQQIPQPAPAPQAETPVGGPKTSLTMVAVEKELESIKQRLGAVETGQASAEARLKAIEANGVEISETLKALKDMQATAEKRLAKAEEAALDAKADAKNAVERTVQIEAQQRTIAEAIVETQQRQTPWGMVAAWWHRRKQHAEAERQVMADLRKAEYEQSIKAVADGTFKSAEA